MNDTHFGAWILPAVGAALRLEQRPIPDLHPAGVLVRIESAMVLSYMDKVLDGSIAFGLNSLARVCKSPQK